MALRRGRPIEIFLTTRRRALPMTHSQQSSSMPGGVLFSLYPEESETDDGEGDADARVSSAPEESSLRVSANVLRTALPTEEAPPKEPPSEAASPRDVKTDADPFARVRTILLDDDLDPAKKIQQLLELGTRQLDMEGGYLNRVDAAEGVHRTIAVAGPHPADAPRARELSVTYCRRVVAEGKALAVEHAEEQGWLDDPAYETFGFSTYLGAQVRAGEEVAGTVCFANSRPREAPFDDDEATFLALIARAIGPLLEKTGDEHS